MCISGHGDRVGGSREGAGQVYGSFFEGDQHVEHCGQVGGGSILSSAGWGRTAVEELYRPVGKAGISTESALQGGASEVAVSCFMSDVEDRHWYG